MKAHTSMRLLAVVYLFIAFFGDVLGSKAIAQTFMPDGAKHPKPIVIPRHSVITPAPTDDQRAGPSRAEMFGIKKGQGNGDQEDQRKAEKEALNTPVVFPEDGKGEIVVNVKGQQFVASHIQKDANFAEAATALANQLVKGMVPKVKVIKSDKGKSYYGINIRGGGQDEENDIHSLVVTCIIEKDGSPRLERFSILFVPDNSVVRDKRPGFGFEYQFAEKKGGAITRKAGIVTVKTVTSAGATDPERFDELNKVSGLQSFWERQFLKHLGHCQILVESIDDEEGEIAKK